MLHDEARWPILSPENVAFLDGTEVMAGCMIPLFDLSNHRTDASVEWIHERNGDTDKLRFIQKNGLEAGSELINCYGPKSNYEFLLNYGFSMPDNPYDSFILTHRSLASKGSFLVCLLRDKICRHIDLEYSDTEIFQKDQKIPARFLVTLALAMMDEVSFYAVRFRSSTEVEYQSEALRAATLIAIYRGLYAEAHKRRRCLELPAPSLEKMSPRLKFNSEFDLGPFFAARGACYADLQPVFHQNAIDYRKGRKSIQIRRRF